ncbi:MAG: TonB-dependent receptor plug domain-containing protein [Rhizomicrobium sp.]
MNFQSKIGGTLLCTASILALTSVTRAQEANVESVVVTGSRVIQDATMSPTPLTVIPVGDLQVTTPTNIADGLNKMPEFIGSQTSRSVNNASSDTAANVLNLRSFGGQRTLVLLDGQRIVASNTNGTVNVDTLPQILVQRVDVVTGGASAVYGSDAVSGVVNFILNKNFTGVKIQANSGISTYGDAATYKVAAAAGTSLFGGRGHFEMSLDYFHADPVYDFMRPEPGNNGDWILTGAGTKANPFVDTPNGNLTAFSFGGKITCAGTAANPCLANGQQFVSNGVIGPFNPGTATGTANISSGGDGTHSLYANVTASANLAQAYGRFSYNLDDATTFWASVRGAEGENRANFVQSYIQTGNVPNVFFKNNPFLPAAAQALLAGGTTNTFQMSKYNMNLGYANSSFKSIGTDRVLAAAAGFDGSLFGKYDWHVSFSHGEDRQKEDDPTNINNQYLTAAEDVRLNSSGNPVCFVSTTPQAGLYPNCVPLNLFGPSTLSLEGWKYYVRDTYYTQTNKLDDLSGSIAGTIFDLPAGPVKAAVSGEARWMGFDIQSNGTPGTVDCTGLSSICNNTVSLWQGNTATPLKPVDESVWEMALEVGIPILKDLPLVQSFSADLAGRHTEYSTSGPVDTWKIGLDWHINDDFRLRGTTSIDIRAPTLNDLFSPILLNHQGYTDLLTNSSQTIPVQSQGNPNLVPEVARTYTGGIVFTPTWFAGFTTSLDYYSINMTNAIGTISASTTSVQTLCNQSGGTSPFCALYVRPFPYTNTTPANYPTLLINEALNTAVQKTEGWDFEVNYAFDVKDVIDSVAGTLNLRLLANYQPINQSIAFPGAPLTFQAFPKGHITSFISYKLNSWSFTLQDRWLSSWDRRTLATDVYQNPRVPAYNYVDGTIDKKFMVDDQALDVYLTVQNIGNKKFPVAPNNNSTPDLYYMGVQGPVTTQYDAIGRYFTLGFRFEQ